MAPISDVAPGHPMHAWIEAQRKAAAEPITPQFFPLTETTKYAVGLDLGQAQDYTAISVLQFQKGILDSRSAFARAHEPSDGRGQVAATRIDVRHLERIKLNTSYPDIVDYVARLMRTPPLNGHDDIKPAQLVVDDTGCGRPVSDLLVEVGLKPIRILITAGNEASQTARDRWHVAKGILIAQIDAHLHSGVLRFAPELSESGALRSELLDFRRSVSQAGRQSFGARVGKHDDLVLSIAVAAWWLGQPPLMARAVLGGY
jgi:hypothetical protein